MNSKASAETGTTPTAMRFLANGDSWSGTSAGRLRAVSERSHAIRILPAERASVTVYSSPISEPARWDACQAAAACRPSVRQLCIARQSVLMSDVHPCSDVSRPQSDFWFNGSARRGNMNKSVGFQLVLIWMAAEFRLTGTGQLNQSTRY